MSSGPPTPAAVQRLLARAVALPPALLGVLALVFLGQVAYLLATAGRVEHTDLVLTDAHELQRLMVDQETGVRGYMLTDDPVFLGPYHAAETQAGPAFDELAALVADDPAQGERLTALRADHAEWWAFMRRLVEVVRSGGDPRAVVRTGEGKRRMDAMRARFAEFVRVEEGLREERTRAARTATWVVSGVSLGLALLLGVMLAVRTRGQLLGVVGSYTSALAAADARAEALRRSAHRLATLHAIDRAILAADTTPELVGGALGRVADLVPGAAFVLVPGSAGAPARVLDRDRAADADPALAVPAESSEVEGPQVVSDLDTLADRTPLYEHLHRAGHRSAMTVPLDAGGRRFGVLVLAAPGPGAFTEEHRAVAHEVARQLAIAFEHAEYRERLERHAADLERRVEERTRELQASLANVKQLRGLLPICAWCKKVRDDGDYWHEVEHYVAAHSDTRFTHGMCPECEARQMSQLEGGA
ncbi:MAG TPA: CHASE3 domain-containing protein [Urbifossiella sp.]|nr:CHASE3 domain-containing protein [Urbifossiella sp.]